MRQCSVYGLGIVAQLHQEAFRPSLSSALVHILGIITAPDARSGTPAEKSIYPFCMAACKTE